MAASRPPLSAPRDVCAPKGLLRQSSAPEAVVTPRCEIKLLFMQISGWSLMLVFCTVVCAVFLAPPCVALAIFSWTRVQEISYCLSIRSVSKHSLGPAHIMGHAIKQAGFLTITLYDKGCGSGTSIAVLRGDRCTAAAANTKAATQTSGRSHCRAGQHTQCAALYACPVTTLWSRCVRPHESVSCFPQTCAIHR